jgi:hypothetical protein
LALTFLKRKSISHCLLGHSKKQNIQACMLTSIFNLHSAPGKSRALISYEKHYQLQGKKDGHNNFNRFQKPAGASPNTTLEPRKGEILFVS